MKAIRKYGIPVLAGLLVIAGSVKYMSHLISISNNVNGRELPIHSVEAKEKEIALTFDAAWGNEDIGQILEILEKYDVRATFFMTGDWVEKYSEDVQLIHEAGHDLANHGENHKNMSQLSKADQIQEIMEVHNRIKELTGVEMDLFRPPYGDYNNELILTAEECGYYTIQWDVDSLDWKDYGINNIIDTVVNHENLDNGSIIICQNGTKYTAKALEQVIAGLQAKGYQLVPVSDLIYRDNYHLTVTGRQVKD